jgi:hypothetical protein
MRANITWQQETGLSFDDPVAYRAMWKNDGRYTFAAIDKRASVVREYSAGGHTMKPLRFLGAAHYGVIESIHDDAVYICPNCGAPSTLSALMDGCDYCRTVFTVEDFGLKINSFSFRPDRLGDTVSGAKGFMGVFKRIAPLVFIATFVLVFLLQQPVLPFGLIPVLLSTFIAGAMINGIIYIIGSMAVGAFAFGKLGAQTFQNISELDSDIGFNDTVRRFDPMFSVESFVANIENKLLAILLADNPKQIEALLVPGVQVPFERFRNAFDCNLTGAKFVNFGVDNNYQYLSVSFSIDVYSLDENRGGSSINTKKEVVDVTVVRSVHCRTQQASEVRLQRCGKCGASVNILDGGQCRFCHNDLRLWEHDWVISAFNLR